MSKGNPRVILKLRTRQGRTYHRSLRYDKVASYLSNHDEKVVGYKFQHDETFTNASLTKSPRLPISDIPKPGHRYQGPLDIHLPNPHIVGAAQRLIGLKNIAAELFNDPSRITDPEVLYRKRNKKKPHPQDKGDPRSRLGIIRFEAYKRSEHKFEQTDDPLTHPEDGVFIQVNQDNDKVKERTEQ